MSPRYEVKFSKSAKQALTHDLPEKLAAAAFEFITGALSENPHRVGKQLQEPLFPLYSARRGDYRVIYRIAEDAVLIEVVSMAHRRDAYR
jgi:mRNA interferase RelE/StbE